jgi:RHS repeat-associated protein
MDRFGGEVRVARERRVIVKTENRSLRLHVKRSWRRALRPTLALAAILGCLLVGNQALAFGFLFGGGGGSGDGGGGGGSGGGDVSGLRSVGRSTVIVSDCASDFGCQAWFLDVRNSPILFAPGLFGPVCKIGGDSPLPSCSELEPMLDPTPPPVVTPKADPAANSDGITEDEATGIKDKDCDADEAKDSALCATPNNVGGLPQMKILPFNGQEMLDQTDLYIPGRDATVDVRIMRRHLSGIGQTDPHFGPAWAMNYVHTFVTTDPGAAPQGNGTGELLMKTFGRSDRFAKVMPNAWEGRDGRFDRLVYDGGERALLTMPGGTVLHFKVVRRQQPGQPDVIFGQLSAIVSTKGNMLRIRVDWNVASDAGTFARPRRILSLTDSFGRSILFNYEDPTNRNLLTRIVDFAGREVRYVYSCGGQLTQVQSFAVRSTEGLNDFPDGKTTRYTYYEQAAATEVGLTLPAGAAQFAQMGLDRFRASLASVVAPNEDAGGKSRLSWTYYVEPGGDRHGRVKTHTVGNTTATPSAGGTYQYDYQLLKPAVATENTPVSKTTVLDRRGTRTELVYTARGQLLEEKIFTAGAREGEPAAFTRTFEYNADGEPVEYTDANGIRTAYGLSSSPDSMSRGAQRNEVVREIFPAPGKPADQGVIRSEKIYEPLFNRVFKEIDPRGFESGNDPEDFTTTYIYAYMEALDEATEMMAPGMGITVDELRDRLADMGITDVGDANGDGVTTQFTDNVVKIIRPPVALPSDASRLALAAAQNAVETFSYNDFGQKIRHVDAEGNVTLWEYYGVADADGDGNVEMPGGATDRGGYLRQEIRDAEAGAQRNSGQNPTPVAQTVTYEYGPQGSFPGNPRGVPTAVIDPRGIRDTFLVNERDHVVKRVRAAQVSESPEPGLTAFAYEEHTLYDANDNVVEVRIQNEDTLDGPDDFIRHRFEYDILDQRIAEVWDVGGLAIRNEYAYDPSQNLRSVTRGAGRPEVSVQAYLYDQRNIVLHSTRGAGSPGESVTRTEIDANGNITGWIDGDGDRTQVVYDGYDRRKEVIDRVGNRMVHVYDSASNRVRTTSVGPAVPMGPNVVLAETDWTYDTRHRMFREDRALFDTEGIATLAVGDLQARLSSSSGTCATFDGCVSRIVLHDRLNRVVGEVDGDDELHEQRYDGLSRLRLERDALGNEHLRTYDPSDNLTTVTDVERSPLILNPESFGTLIEFDALDRPMRTTESGGQVTTFAYDSRDNLIRRADGHRNETEWRHDRLNRVLEERRYLAPLVASQTARDGSATRFNAAQGGGDGRIALSFAYDDLHRVVERTDDNGKTTEYVYDTLDRRIEVGYPDGTRETFTYSDDDEPLTHVTQNGSVVTWVHDAAERPVELSVDSSAEPGTRGTTSRTWGYDGLDRVVVALDDNGTEPNVTVRRFYDSLSRRVRETQTIEGFPALSVDEQWKAENQRAMTVYPNGRAIRSVHDALDREERIEEGSQVLANYEYVGAWRDVRITLGNGSAVDLRNTARKQTMNGTKPGYDRNRRNVRRRWTQSGGGLIAGYGAAYNDVHVLIQENRDHFGRGDRLGLDSAGRVTHFRHNAPLSGEAMGALEDASIEAARTSTWLLDGAHGWATYIQRNVNRSPVLDTAGGVNEYASFDGVPQSFDADGNRTSDGVRSYVYDFDDRLVEAKTAAGATLGRYVYDADGRRVMRITSAGTTRYLYRGWEVLEERDAANAVIQQYVYRSGIDRPVQFRKLAGTGAGTYYYHDDPRGNVGALTDAAQAVVYRTEYDAWGDGSLGGSALVSPADPNTFLASDPVGNPLLWQARRLDPETGLYYYRHRYYDPTQGRFLQADPIGSWGDAANFGNRYAFAGNVLGAKDPLGLHGDAAAVEGDFSASDVLSGDGERYSDWNVFGNALDDLSRDNPYVEASRFVGRTSCDPSKLPAVEEVARLERNKERRLTLSPDSPEAQAKYIEAYRHAAFGIELAGVFVSPGRAIAISFTKGLPRVGLRTRPPSLLPPGTPNRTSRNAARSLARDIALIKEGARKLGTMLGIEGGSRLSEALQAEE